MWKKRACSVLLALMVAMTAIPFSAVPVYSQEAETMQDASDTEAIGEEEVLTQEPAQAAEEAVEEETDTEDVSAAWDAQSQEEEQQQEEALSSDEAAAEDDVPASEVEKKTDAEAEDADDQEKAVEDGPDTAEESSPEADSDDALPSGQADDTQTSDEETPDEVISEEPVTETVSEDAMAEGQNEQYRVDLVSRDGKTIVCPGEEIVLDAHVFRDPDGSAVSSGLKYKWEIVKGIDGGYAALDDNIEGAVGDYPSATLKFTGIPDSASESFGYGVTVKVTVYDGKDSGTELTSGTIDTLLLDEYFEITPHRIDQIQVGEERTIPISIRYCGYYFDSFRYGYDVEWRFTYDENVLQLTDPDGNILDGTGTEPYEPGNSMNEPEITIRRLSGGWTDLEAKATFHYIDHNQNKNFEDGFSKVYHFDGLEDRDENGGRIWFDINENRIFSDGTYSFDLHTEDIPEAYDVQVQVGHYDDNGLVEAYTEGKEYSFDGSKLTLDGQRIFQRGYHWFGMEVQAVSRQDGHILCGNGFGFESWEARAEYDFAEDKEMLTGWYATVNHWERVYVENAGNPKGMDLSYETTNVSIVSQEPVESGREVLEMRIHYPEGDTSSDNYWWHYEAVNQGTAVLRVDYKDIDGNAQSYTFKVYVKGDVYGVHVFTEDGSTVTRPGGTINLETDVWHHSIDDEQEGDTDDLVYAWNLKAVDGSPDPENFATLQESDGGKKASVTFSAPADYENQRSELEAEVFIYTGSVAEENKVGYDSIRLSMANSYTELWPAQLDSYADVGTSQTITAEFRIYPGSDGREYDLVSPEDGTVTYYWHYDDDNFRIYDKDGKQVGNDDESGAYIGSDASTGSACDFTIYRKRQWDTDIFLDACWRDANGEEHWENRHFHMDERYYMVWPDVEDDRVFNDGNTSYPVIVDGLPEDAVYGVDYNIDLKIGPLGDHGVDDTFREGVEYTFDGHTLTFNGKKLAECGLEDDQVFGADIALIIADEEVWVEGRDFRYREARTDYDREYDRDMLTGWDGSVNGSYHVHLENSEHRDGYDTEYKVLDVKVISDEPWEGEDGPVIDDFHRDQNENDPPDYWWYYRVENRGKATLEVTYEDLDGQEQKYTFDLYVGDDVYRVHMDSVDSDRQGLPGDKFELFADGHHEFYDENKDYQDTSEGLGYQWKIEEGGEFARLEVDQNNPAKALLCLNEELPDGWDWIDEMIRVSVRVLDKDGIETGGYDESNFWVKSEFYEIWPLSLDPELEMGASIEDVEFEVRQYSTDKENYEVIDDWYDVQYEWHFDEKAFTIADVTDGKETVLSDGETAEGNTFTITRKVDWHTDYSVRAFWTQGRDEERDAWGNYWINQKNYEIRFFKVPDTIRSNETKSFAIDTSGLGNFKPDIFMFVTYQSKEGEIDDHSNFTDMTEGVEYTIDPSGTSVTVDGKLVEKRLTESAYDKDRFYIGAAMMYDGSPYKFFKFCPVDLLRGDKEDQEISASDQTIVMYGTGTASVEGAQGALTFTSGNESIVKVDAASGKLTPVAPGTAQITVNAAETDDYYAAETTFTVTVKKLDLKDAVITYFEPSGGFVYDGQPKTPQSMVTCNGVLLSEGTDYTVSYQNNINAGNATLTISGVTNCEGTASVDFNIAKAAQNFTVKASVTSIDAGKTTKVAATGAKENPRFTFTSSNAKVATVDAAGTVTGKAAGTATITVRSAETANYKAASKTIKITVNKVLKKPGNCHFVKWNNAKYTSCRIGWNKVDGAEGYETLLSWTDGSHASRTITKSNVLYRDCTVHPQHVSQMMARAFYTLNGQRKFGPWSNVEYITPSPTKLTVKNTSSGTNLKMNISWNIIYGCNGYNVFLTTNPNGTWYWNQSTSTKATATSAAITKYRGSKLKKNVRYYVRIVTRRQRNGVFCTVPMPAANTYIGTFIIK